MRAEITVAPTCRSLGLEEVKSHLRLELGFTDEDDLLNAYIDAAQERVEDITNKKLLPQIATVYFDNWPYGNSIELPFYPLRSIATTGIVYSKSTGNSTTFSSSAWATDTISEPGRVVLKNSESWPSDALYDNNPIKIRINCGYASSTAIPSKIKLAMKLLIGHWYENREATVPNSVSLVDIPQGVSALLYSERKFTF